MDRSSRPAPSNELPDGAPVGSSRGRFEGCDETVGLERPLTAEDWAVLEHSFGRVRAEFPIVEFFELFNRQVLRYRWRGLAAVCRRLDASLGRMRALRKYSYRVLVIAETDSPPGGRVASPAP